MVAAIFDAHAAGPTHTWVLKLASDEPVVPAGEEARLHQVVVNLLANARMHTPPGRGPRSGCPGRATKPS